MLAAVKLNCSPKLPEDMLPFVPDLTQAVEMSMPALLPVPEKSSFEPESPGNVCVPPFENCTLTCEMLNVDATEMAVRLYVTSMCGMFPGAATPFGVVYVGVKVRLP